jgi:hypothetical protein
LPEAAEASGSSPSSSSPRRGRGHLKDPSRTRPSNPSMSRSRVRFIIAVLLHAAAGDGWSPPPFTGYEPRGYSPSPSGGDGSFRSKSKPSSHVRWLHSPVHIRRLSNPFFGLRLLKKASPWKTTVPVMAHQQPRHLTAQTVICCVNYTLTFF